MVSSIETKSYFKKLNFCGKDIFKKVISYCAVKILFYKMPVFQIKITKWNNWFLTFIQSTKKYGNYVEPILVWNWCYSKLSFLRKPLLCSDLFSLQGKRLLYGGRSQKKWLILGKSHHYDTSLEYKRFWFKKFHFHKCIGLPWFKTHVKQILHWDDHSYSIQLK